MRFTDLFLDYEGAHSQDTGLQSINAMSEIWQDVQRGRQTGDGLVHQVVLTKFAAFQRGTPHIFDPRFKPTKQVVA